MKLRHFVFIALCVLPQGLGAARAGTRDDVLFGVSRCGGIADDRVWLDCVYGAAQPMRAQLGLLPAPAAQQNLVPPAIPGLPAPPIQATDARAIQGADAASNPPAKPGFFDRLWPF